MVDTKLYLPSSEDTYAIYEYQYWNHNNLTNVVIKNNIDVIGDSVFSDCRNLKKITLPKTLSYMGSSVFSECENLEEIVLPSGIKKIKYRTFGNCKRLKRIVIPEGVEEIEWGVFAGCENLEEVVLPSTLKKIGEQTFLNCKKLKKINIPDNITTLPYELFKGCHNLDIVLNKNIKELGSSVFQDCYKLSTFPENVSSFGENCFKNCKNIKSVTLNKDIKSLPDGMFEGCINLKNIYCEKKIDIGKRCFRNCKSLEEIPPFVESLNDKAFENCTGIKKIDIFTSHIPYACFRGCTNLKEVLNQDIITSMDSYAFSGCEKLESFDIHNLGTIPAEAFSNCKSLKKVKIGTYVKKIDTRAFYNSENLVDINLPDTIESINKEAFKNCNSIKSITIPGNLKYIGDGAFSYMNSLENIEVSKYNKTFITPDNKILINQAQQKLVLYASGIKDKSYSLKDYNIQYDNLGQGIIRPINVIGEFAFAGCKNLEELTICACTDNIESTAFYGCDNLKKLNIEAIDLYTSIEFNIRDHGRYYSEERSNYKVYIPFEEVTFTGKLTSIFSNAFNHFKNVKKINIPTDRNFFIHSNAFHDCNQLKEVSIPEKVGDIDKNAFNDNTKILFANKIPSNGFIRLESAIVGNNRYKSYTFNNEVYYIENIDNDRKFIKITKEQIDKLCDKSEFVNENPVLFLDFMNDLIKHDLDIRMLYNGILMSSMNLVNRNILLNNLKRDDIFFLEVLKNSKILEEKDRNTEFLLQDKEFIRVVNYIELLRKYNIHTPELHSKFFMANMDIKVFEALLKIDLDLFKKVVIQSKLLEKDNEMILMYDNNMDERPSYYLTYEIFRDNKLLHFIKLIKKYNIKDRFLFNKSFIATSNNPLMDEMFKVYDANIKRLLKSSQVINKNISVIDNLNDLLVLMKITGALEEDDITRKRATTFINEKIFVEKLTGWKTNEFRIIGDDIHRVFNFQYIPEEFDEEFANFFLENYQKLVDEERKKSGFIQRVYTNFRQISKTCTSNKGSQRKLKVTIDKCKNYLLNNKFNNVPKKYIKLAELISEWYDSNIIWDNALKVYIESLNAPRNIFTKTTIDDEGNIIYDNDKNHDLKEETNENFSYEWLPKQDYDNLILGKYCNCCASIGGDGQGIMRASMILDNCQNMVIRNSLGTIIAKSTIYVNKNAGYAVYNNVETSFNYRDKENLKKIYDAFLRGSKAFIKTYNENNQEVPITKITIGANRNTILDFLTDENNHPEVSVKKSISYGKYSLNGSGYNGDWEHKQRLVLKK